MLQKIDPKQLPLDVKLPAEFMTWLNSISGKLDSVGEMVNLAVWAHGAAWGATWTAIVLIVLYLLVKRPNK